MRALGIACGRARGHPPNICAWFQRREATRHQRRLRQERRRRRDVKRCDAAAASESLRTYTWFDAFDACAHRARLPCPFSPIMRVWILQRGPGVIRFGTLGTCMTVVMTGLACIPPPNKNVTPHHGALGVGRFPESRVPCQLPHLWHVHVRAHGTRVRVGGGTGRNADLKNAPWPHRPRAHNPGVRRCARGCNRVRYVVGGWLPDGTTAKLWRARGEREDGLHRERRPTAP